MSRRGVFVFLCERGAAASYGAYPPDGSYNERFNTCCGVVRVVFLLSGRCAGYMCGGFCGVRYAGGGRSRMPGPTPPVIRARVVLLCRERACESAIGRFFYRRVEREPRERCAPLLWLSLHLYSNSFAMPTMDTTQPNHTPHNKAKSKVHALNSLPQIISSPRTRSSLLAARIDVAALSPEHIDL